MGRDNQGVGEDRRELPPCCGVAGRRDALKTVTVPVYWRKKSPPRKGASRAGYGEVVGLRQGAAGWVAHVLFHSSTFSDFEK